MSHVHIISYTILILYTYLVGVSNPSKAVFHKEIPETYHPFALLHMLHSSKLAEIQWSLYIPMGVQFQRNLWERSQGIRTMMSTKKELKHTSKASNKNTPSIYRKLGLSSCGTCFFHGFNGTFHWKNQHCSGFHDRCFWALAAVSWFRFQEGEIPSLNQLSAFWLGWVLVHDANLDLSCSMRCRQSKTKINLSSIYTYKYV